MGRTTWFEQHGYASPSPYFCEDQELLLRTNKQSRFHSLPEALLAYRVQSGVKWGKRCRTWMALLRLQTAYFFKQKEFHLLLMAALVAAIRVLRDTLWLFIPIGQPGVNRLKRNAEVDEFIAYWESALPRWGRETKRWS